MTGGGRLIRGAALLAAGASIAVVAARPLSAEAARLPSVASINLCADQLVLDLADPAQILTVSWLSADSEESMLARAAARFPLNYGSAEELLRYRPDVVIAGTFTSGFTRALLARLGYPVVEIAPAESIEDIERNLREVARAVGQIGRGDRLIAEMRARVMLLWSGRPSAPRAAVVVRPGGFTVGAGSLADALMRLANVSNVAAERGLDRWGSLSMETLLSSAPKLVVLTGYRANQPSLANAVLAHPALARLRAEMRSITVPAALWACGLPQSLDSVDLLLGAASE